MAAASAVTSSALDTYLSDFQKDGFFILKGALSPEEVKLYKNRIDELAKKSPNYIKTGYLRASNIIEDDIQFSELMDHPSVYSYVGSLLSDHFRIMSTEAIIRPRKGDVAVRWHEDGPDAPSYRFLGTPAPLCQLKIGYFITDVSDGKSGNLVVLPGSHLLPDAPAPTLPHGNALPGALSVLAKPGDAIVFHNALYHCVQPNETEQPRYMLYYTYCYPWMAPFDRSASSTVLRSLLTPERRALLMDFETPSRNYDLIKRVATWQGSSKAAMLAPLKLATWALAGRVKSVKRRLIH